MSWARVERQPAKGETVKSATKRRNFVIWAITLSALLFVIIYFGRGRYFLP